MSLKNILVISGQGGLFRFVSRGRTAVIVENMADGKRANVSASAKISMLEDIAIFTDKEEMPLHEVFKRIQAKENGGPAPSRKAPDVELKKYFAETIPEYDRQRVYVSDIRKVIGWYNGLLELGITDFEPEPAEENAEGGNPSEKKSTENQK